MTKPLHLAHVHDPDRDFERELQRFRHGHATDAPPEVIARRAALADAIERAHAAYEKRTKGTSKP